MQYHNSRLDKFQTQTILVLPEYIQNTFNTKRFQDTIWNHFWDFSPGGGVLQLLLDTMWSNCNFGHFLQTPPPLQLFHSVLTDFTLKIGVYHPQKCQIWQFFHWIPHFWYHFTGYVLLTTVQELNISIIFQVC